MKKAGRWLERFLLLTGVIAVDVWIWSHAGAVIFQSWQERTLDQEIEADAPAPGAPPAKTAKRGGPLGRLVIPRLRLRAVVCEGTGENTLSLALGHIPST